VGFVGDEAQPARGFKVAIRAIYPTQWFCKMIGGEVAVLEGLKVF